MALGPSDPARPSDESHVWPGHAPTLFETPMQRVGRKGINLQDALDSWPSRSSAGIAWSNCDGSASS